MKHIIILFLIFSVLSISAQEQSSQENHHNSQPDSHAPIGVMGDHMHQKNEWMISYRYMNMRMEDLKEGSEDVSFSDALADYMVTPTRMDMQMHMIGVMYAPSNKVTLSLMLPYVRFEMDHLTRMNTTFITESDGVGDIALNALYSINKAEHSNLHAQVGLVIP